MEFADFVLESSHTKDKFLASKKHLGNILKIRTLLVNDKKKGIGKIYLSIVDNIAICNNIDYIYLTIKNDNKELIDFMKRYGYKEYNQYNDEFVYYKELKWV